MWRSVHAQLRTAVIAAAEHWNTTGDLQAVPITAAVATRVVDTIVDYAFEWRLVSGSGDRQVRVWYPAAFPRATATASGAAAEEEDAAAGDDERRSDIDSQLTLSGHFEEVLAVTCFRDGRIASAGSDESIRLIAAAAGGSGSGNSGSGAGSNNNKKPSAHCQLTLTSGGEVYGLAAMHDNRRLLSCGGDNDISVWDLVSGSRISVLSGHTDVVSKVALLHPHTSGQIVSASYDKTLRVWMPSNHNTYLCLNVLRGHADELYAVTTCDDGRIISGAADGCVKIWTPQYAPPPVPAATAATATDAAAKDGAKTAATAAAAAAAVPAVRPAQSYSCDATLTTFAGPVLAVGVLRDGRIVSALGDGTVRIWTANAPAPAAAAAAESAPKSNGLSINVSPAPSPAVAALGNVPINVGWQLSTTIRVSYGYVSSLVVCPDGSSFITAGEDHRIRVWTEIDDPAVVPSLGPVSVSSSLPDPNAVKALKLGESIISIGVGAKRRYRLQHTARGHEHTIFNLDIMPIPPPAAPAAAAATAANGDAKSAPAATIGATTKLPKRLDALPPQYSRREFLQIAIRNAFRDIHQLVGAETTAPADATAATATAASDATATVAVASSFAVPSAILSLILSYTFQWRLITAGANDPTIKCWYVPPAGESIDRSECVSQMTGHSDGICCVSVLKDGRIATGSEDVSIKLWSIGASALHAKPGRGGTTGSAGGRCEQTLTGHTRDVLCTVVLHDGRLASGSVDGTIRVWSDPLSDSSNHINTKPLVIKKHVHSVRCMTVLEDGRLASGGDDGTIHIFTVMSGHFTVSVSIRAHEKFVRALTTMTTADGVSRLVSASQDYTIKLWDTTLGGSTPLKVLNAHTYPVTALAVLDDGRLVSCGQDKSVRVWDVDRAVCLHTMTGHAGYVSDVLALPDGRIISSGLFDATIRVWSVPPLSAYPKRAPAGPVLDSAAQMKAAAAGSTAAATAVARAKCEGVIDTDEHDIACLALLYDDSWPATS